MQLHPHRILKQYFIPHQLSWIDPELSIDAQGKQAFALAEKSVRISWTMDDAFKNIRKRVEFKNRDYLFGTKDYPSALEYMRQALCFAKHFNCTAQSFPTANKSQTSSSSPVGLPVPGVPNVGGQFHWDDAAVASTVLSVDNWTTCN
jgi:hypothetical protein